MRTQDLNPKDYKFIVEKGEPGFSPERNKQVIENSIRKYDLAVAKKRKEWKEQTAERVDAIVSFLKAEVASNNPLSHYFGKRWIAYLRGEHLLDDIYQKRLEMDTNRLYMDLKHEQKQKTSKAEKV
jgi:hypothetical protein